MITRFHLQNNAITKLKAIKTLKNAQLYDNVVSDSGYVVEFALKAAICKYINNNFPETDKKYRVHSAEKLIDLANLRSNLELEKNNNIDFFINWSLLSTWDVNFRYKPPGTFGKTDANDYINALEDKKGGVFKWIKIHW